ncbi:hypothetical protein SAMN05660297_03030 [Natronincola peptidivorans]|uniref:Uncharacterized protein n=1 Tax=Natronincola peptidivorans TaxID=426128 RepID=A0A1I0G3K5_9FIRM|nr:hypothetical protein [Natronincola peptidivorans]SET64600.1 hypothetical protein SAMN05660297_03030 [Natronincola peptidivorans]
MNNKIEYNVDKKKQRIYLIILLVIAIPLVIFSISSLVEASKNVAVYRNNIEEITTNGIGTDAFISHLRHQRAVEERNMSIFFFVLSISMLFFILHFHFFTDRKLILDEKGINLYSIYKKEPSKVFLWKDIKSIQFGEMYASGGRIVRYRMKIRYTRMIGTVLNNVSETIPIRKFQKHDDLIKNIQELGEVNNIEVFHMND